MNRSVSHFVKAALLAAVSLSLICSSQNAHAQTSGNCPQSLIPRLGGVPYAQVAPEPPTPLRMHANNNAKSTVIASLPVKTHFFVLYGPQCAFVEMGADPEPYTWYLVRTDSGLSGWVAESDENNYFIEALPSDQPPPQMPTWTSRTFSISQPAYDISWSPTGKAMLIAGPPPTANGESSAVLYSIDGKLLLQGIPTAMTSGWSNTGELAYPGTDPSSGNSGMLLIDDQAKMLATIDYLYLSGRNIWSPDGKWLAFGDGLISLYGPDGKPGPKFELLKDVLADPFVATWSPDSKLLAAFIMDKDKDEYPTVVLWDVAGKAVTTLDFAAKMQTSNSGGEQIHGYDLTYHDFVWSPDSQKLIVLASRGKGSPNDTLARGQLWSRAGTYLGDVGQLALTMGPLWSPDGKQLMMISLDNDFLVLNNFQPSAAAQGLESNHLGLSTGFSWSPDGQKFVAGYDKGFAEWYDKTDRLLTEIEADCVTHQGLAWSPDGKYLATGVEPGSRSYADEILSGTVYVYDSSARLVAVLTDASPPLAWSADGKTLASLSLDKTKIHLWTVK